MEFCIEQPMSPPNRSSTVRKLPHVFIDSHSCSRGYIITQGHPVDRNFHDMLQAIEGILVHPCRSFRRPKRFWPEKQRRIDFRSWWFVRVQLARNPLVSAGPGRGTTNGERECRPSERHRERSLDRRDRTALVDLVDSSAASQAHDAAQIHIASHRR